MNPHYHIIIRTCDVVYSVHQTPRPFGLDKRSLIKLCFLSLIDALGDRNYSIHILGDKLSDEILAFFAQFPVHVSNDVLGNDESIRQGILHALERPDSDWIYLCEDDYLYSSQAFVWIDDLITHYHSYIDDTHLKNELRFQRGKLRKLPLVIHTPDYPDRYLTRYMRRSLIFLSRYCHWRQITNTTFTLLTQASTFKRYKNVFLHSTKGANDGLLSKKLYAGMRFRNRALCLSPIPGVATHMHEEVMSPLVEWENRVQEIRKKYMQ